MKKTLALALLTLAVSAPAFAGPGDNPRRRVEFYDNAGTLHEMSNFDDAMLNQMMQHAQKLAPGSIVVTSNGQVFVLQDFKTASGRMLSDELMQHQ